MGLVYIKHIDKDVCLGLWEMDDSLDAARDCPPEAWQHIGKACATRQRETAAVYRLLRTMTGRDDIVIRHEPSGRPHVKGICLSISHTKGFACVIMSPTRNVAVDIEHNSDRVRRITSHFLRDDETATDVRSMLIHWCAKETIYKFCSDDRLTFKESRVTLDNILSDNGTDCHGLLSCENLKTGEKVRMAFVCNSRFTMTYCMDEKP